MLVLVSRGLYCLLAVVMVLEWVSPESAATTVCKADTMLRIQCTHPLCVASLYTKALQLSTEFRLAAINTPASVEKQQPQQQQQ